jgi:hypothetical protein
MRLTQRECDILRAENKRLICRVSELEHENGRLEGAIEGLVGEEFRQAERAVKAEEREKLKDALIEILQRELEDANDKTVDLDPSTWEGTGE